jgi:hypothetical protein
MEVSNDIIVEIQKLQKQITNHMGVSAENLVFDYKQEDNKVRLNLITINPRHNQSFLFESVIGFEKIDALKKMYEFVQSYKDKTNSYTIQWRSKGDNELHTSYFSAKNIVDALEKLYFGRDMNSLLVYSVVLNPVS